LRSRGVLYLASFVFILIGSDGREYGPASAEHVKQWIADGRATLDTLGKRVGEEAWRRLVDFPELHRRAPISDAPPPKLPAPAASAPAPVAAPTMGAADGSSTNPMLGAGAVNPTEASAPPAVMGAGTPTVQAAIPGGSGSAASTVSGAAGVTAPGASGVAAPVMPPEVDPRAYAAELISRAGKLRIWHCVGRAWRLTTRNFWSIVGGTFIGLLVLGVVQVVPFLGTIAGIFLSGVLYGGLYLYYLKHARGESADLGVIFSGFSSAFLPLMLASLVSSLLTTLGLLLLILPGIYLAIGYLFTFLLIQDRKLDFWCAMEVSRRVISAQWWRVFGLMIVAGFLACLGVIGLFIGIFVTLPILFGAIVYAYEDLVNPSPEAGAVSPQPPV